MKFLQMCQDTMRWSGTGGRGQIEKVTTTAEFPSKVVDFVRTAWVDIQQSQKHWRFMRKDFVFQTVANKHDYAWSEMILPESQNRAINRFDHWIHKVPWFIEDPNRGSYGFVPSVFTEDRNEYVLGKLYPIDYECWWDRYFRFAQTGNRPYEYAIGPDDKLLFGPTPDKVYTIRGQYKPSAHHLEKNEDQPEGLPDDYHEMIVWKAVIMVNDYDAGARGRDYARERYVQKYDNLLATQLPKTKMAGALY